MKIICIPYAGGTAEIFDDLQKYLADGYQICSIEYAGHGSRKQEPYYESFDEMVFDAACQINELLKKEDPKEAYILFGYSMGTIVEYELYAKNLLIKKPSGIVLGCHEPPDVKWAAAGYYMLSDEAFLDHMRKLGGLPGCEEEMLANRFFRKLVFEPIRKDYELLADYTFGIYTVLEAPVKIIFSPNDIDPEKMTGWGKFLRDDAELIPMGSSHFLIREVPEQVAAVLSEFDS